MILLSCVRSDHGREHARGIGFVKDARRINVSMTRAKHSLFILGHAKTLQQENIWQALLENASERGCYLKASSPLAIWFEAASQEPCKLPEHETSEKVAREDEAAISGEAEAEAASGGTGAAPAAAPALIEDPVVEPKRKRTARR